MALNQAPDACSARLDHDSATSIPADAKLRPLRDQLIIEPLPVVLSKIIVTHEDTKPLRGIVKAAGPGIYPKCYDHPDKNKRTKMWDSPIFRPTQVKVGDVVELGGYGLGGYSFQTLWWGDVKHIICREEDISGVLQGVTAEQAREEAANATA
jgi:hypothetical protein